MRLYTDRRDLTARHEAAHLVVYAALCKDINGMISLRVRPSSHSGGYLRAYFNSLYIDPTFEVVMVVAGLVAEFMVQEMSEWEHYMGWSTDITMAVTVLQESGFGSWQSRVEYSDRHAIMVEESGLGYLATDKEIEALRVACALAEEILELNVQVMNELEDLLSYRVQLNRQDVRSWGTKVKKHNLSGDQRYDEIMDPHYFTAHRKPWTGDVYTQQQKVRRAKSIRGINRSISHWAGKFGISDYPSYDTSLALNLVKEHAIDWLGHQ